MVTKPPIPGIIGRGEADATDILIRLGFRVRVIKRDGKACIVTRDYRLDRVNLSIENGLVINLDVG